MGKKVTFAPDVKDPKPAEICHNCHYRNITPRIIPMYLCIMCFKLACVRCLNCLDLCLDCMADLDSEDVPEFLS